MLPNLFVAVVPPPEALAPLASEVARLRRQEPDLGWVAESRWHVTLCFLGPVQPTDVLRERLGRVAARHPPVRLQVRGGGRFGDRVLWARLEGDLRPLAVGVTRAVDRSGFDVEERPFRAHLTLARGRRHADLRPLAEELGDVEGPTWTAGEIVLMSSGRPDYLALQSWPLSGR